MKQYSKILMVLLITAFAVSVGQAQPPTIKKTATASVVTCAPHPFDWEAHQSTDYFLVDEIPFSPTLSDSYCYERSCADLTQIYVLQKLRTRWYEIPPLLKSTRQFANFNKTKLLYQLDYCFSRRQKTNLILS